MMEEVHGRQVGFSRGCIAEGTAGTDNDGRTFFTIIVQIGFEGRDECAITRVMIFLRF